MTSVRLIKRYCKGCGLCVAFCKQGALKMSDEVGPQGFQIAQVVDPERCTGCAQCALMCPEAGVEIVEEQECPA